LAGKEGYALEKFFGDPFVAARLIYKKSSSIHVAGTRFFETDTVALADMERCANEEKSLTN